LPGPNPVRDADVALALAVDARWSAEAAVQATLQAGAGGDAQIGLAHAEAALVVAERKLDEAQARVRALEARRAAAEKSGGPDPRLALELEVARSDVGYRLFDIGQARNQLLRATRVAQGAANAAGAATARAERSNVQPIEDPEVAARLYLEGGGGAGGNLAMTRREVFERQWRDTRPQTGTAPAFGWRRADGTVVVDMTNPQVKDAVERLATARKGGSGGGNGGRRGDLGP
jgi:hypothetical protein